MNIEYKIARNILRYDDMVSYTSKKGITIVVDNDKCEGVGECVKICPASVYEIQEGKAVPTQIDECIECCNCVDSCPKNAITHNSC